MFGQLRVARTTVGIESSITNNAPPISRLCQVGAQCDLDNFDHVARYNPDAHRIEMWLRSTQDQTLDIPDLDLSVPLKKGEEIRTELRTKYDHALGEDLLRTAGFEMVKWHTDPDQLISLALAKKP